MTSGPIPSPGTTAIRLFWLTGWKVINSVGDCHSTLSEVSEMEDGHPAHVAAETGEDALALPLRYNQIKRR
jgi:hypothetical protein